MKPELTGNWNTDENYKHMSFQDYMKAYEQQELIKMSKNIRKEDEIFKLLGLKGALDTLDEFNQKECLYDIAEDGFDVFDEEDNLEAYPEELQEIYDKVSKRLCEMYDEQLTKVLNMVRE